MKGLRLEWGGWVLDEVVRKGAGLGVGLWFGQDSYMMCLMCL